MMGKICGILGALAFGGLYAGVFILYLIGYGI